MAVQQAVAERWKALTGNTIIEGYGLSETSPVVCVNPLGMTDVLRHDRLPAALHRGLDPRRRRQAGARRASPARSACAGPQVMRGYWNRPDETARAMTPDGFFRTGDVAVMEPDGQIRIVDRMKDMILVSGFNVYPNEVEDVLAGPSGGARMRGGRRAERGDRRDGGRPRGPEGSGGLHRRHARACAAPSSPATRCPAGWCCTTRLPKTNVGKVLRRVAARRDAARPDAGPRRIVVPRT